MAAYAATKHAPAGLILEAGFPDARSLFRGPSPMAFLALFLDLPLPRFRLPARRQGARPWSCTATPTRWFPTSWVGRFTSGLKDRRSSSQSRAATTTTRRRLTKRCTGGRFGISSRALIAALLFFPSPTSPESRVQSPEDGHKKSVMPIVQRPSSGLPSPVAGFRPFPLPETLMRFPRTWSIALAVVLTRRTVCAARSPAWLVRGR